MSARKQVIERGRPALSVALTFLVSVLALAGSAAPAFGQAAEGQTVTVAVGHAQVVRAPGRITRVFIANDQLADAVPVSPSQVVVNGKQVGTSNLLLWVEGQVTSYEVRVTADAPTLQRQLREHFPDEDIQVRASGNSLVLSGSVRNSQAAERAVALAESMGEDVQVVNHLSVPDRQQVLLRVRFAEVSRQAMDQISSDFIHLNEAGVGDASISTGAVSGSFPEGGPTKTFSDAVNFFLFHRGVRLGTFIQALRSHGMFRSLAEPNLITSPGDSASFLAGGEFPFPVVQGGAQSGAVSIQFREFGIRLNFTPTITNSGAIRLAVAPEVSQLDFANGLSISGFQIPAILSRKANTVVEVADGQTFAIAGLVDQSMTENVSKVPVLGDIPILGQLFRSEEMRQERSELLVLVTPELIRPAEASRSKEVPTGEPEDWPWMKQLEMEDTVSVDSPPTLPDTTGR